MRKFLSQANRKSPDYDLILLSAYLDDELTEAERAELEQRLSVEPALRRELEELQATTLLLRELAPARPPRSFTLDPATAPVRPAFWPGWLSSLPSGPGWLWSMQSGAIVVAVFLLAMIATTAVFMGQATPRQSNSVALQEASPSVVAGGARSSGETANVDTLMSPAPTIAATPQSDSDAGVVGIAGGLPARPDAKLPTETDAAGLPSDAATTNALPPGDVVQEPETSSPGTAELVAPQATAPATMNTPSSDERSTTPSLLDTILPLAAVGLLGIGLALLFLWYRRV